MEHRHLAPVQTIEAHVRTTMRAAGDSTLAIGHGFAHVDRVRRWAMRLARDQGFTRLDLVEVTALLHDIGLAKLDERTHHAAVGADMAEAYLKTLGWPTAEEVEAVVHAIRHHSDVVPIPPLRGASLPEALGAILREADILDALGPVGLMRACASKATRPFYDPNKVKGPAWGLSGDEFTRLRGEGRLPAATIVDQVNLQIAMYDNLSSEASRALGAPQVAYLRHFVAALAGQVGTDAGTSP
jgi:putative nucleotidyltransferase with HDIG domain